MNKKLQLITFQNYTLINYLKVFQKKLGLENTEISPSINQPNGKLEQFGDDIQVYSQYDSSNLLFVTADQDCINILLNSDSNTNGCTQWFNFQIKSLKVGLTIKFKILNNRRSKQLLTSCNFYTSKNACFDVHYYKTNINHPFYANEDASIAQYQKQIQFYTLEFKYTFQDQEFITFAYAEPYPLNRVLQLKDYTVIGYTQLNNPIIRIKRGKAKKYVVILARQHPCETSGSFIAEELIKIINSTQYRYIIYPMINPDGVFLGNSRCNKNGIDLNRKWINPSQQEEPELYYIKQSLTKYQQRIKFMIDLHGHSTKQNYFIYGCSNNSNCNSKIKNFVKQFMNCKHFSLKDCSFATQISRKCTARQTFWSEFNIQYSMTIEISLFGSKQGQLKGRFSSLEYSEIALQIYNSIEQFYEDNIDLIKLPQIECLNESYESESEYEQDIVNVGIVQKQQQKYRSVEKQNQKSQNVKKEEDVVQQKQQILPKIRISKVMSKSEHRASSIFEIDNSFVFRLEQYQNNFNVIKYFPQRNVYPKRMSCINKNQNKSATIDIEQLKKCLIL
ncbi:unnamed protein product [Paramecium sonneborni]|uniref:Peptidase M14 domain-containing protein n=1 Tax=Paramecium sonneborni TaxID=65129 RepID=A0A8S1KIS6_9CILI|nr:unnamed protein product [Paramecium sonneborni]